MDATLLRLLDQRDTYTRFKPYLKEHVLSRPAHKILSDLGRYYKDHPLVTKLDWHAFQTWFMVLRNSSLTPADAVLFNAIFDNIRKPAAAGSDEELLAHYITTDYATRIGTMAIAIAEGKDKKHTLDDITALVAEHDKELGRAITMEDLFETSSVEETLAATLSTGYPWRLPELNKSFGPLRQGDFFVVVARPEVGKTTFLASEVSHMAMHIPDDRPVVWVNNEERSSKVNARIMQAALGRDTAWLAANAVAAQAEFDKLMKKKGRIMVLKNDADLCRRDKLDSLFRDLRPALIVFDQLDKVEGFGNEERDDIRLGKMYKWARDLSHQYGPVIAASQADAGAEGMRYLQQNHMRGSKTDKPGEADAILGIGKDHTDANPNTRYLNCMKNKLAGGGATHDPAVRHGKWEVLINPEIARYDGRV